MRITDKELDTLLKSGEAHSFDKRFNFRGAQENTGTNSTVKRFSLIAAALAIILIASSVPVIALVTANKKTPAPPEVMGEAVTDEQTKTDVAAATEDQPDLFENTETKAETAEDGSTATDKDTETENIVDTKKIETDEITENDNTEESKETMDTVITEEQTTEASQTETEPIATEEITEVITTDTSDETKEMVKGEDKPLSQSSYGFITDLFDKDKANPVVLTEKDYGRSNWLNKDIIRNYRIDLPTDGLPDDYNYSGEYANVDFYGYAKESSDVYELELKLINTSDCAGSEYLVRIESDDNVEIISDTTIRSEFRVLDDPALITNANEFITELPSHPSDYVSIPVKFRFTGDAKWVDFKVYIFVRTPNGTFDQITPAEEYFANGYSISDKAFPDWNETDIVLQRFRSAATSPYTVRFIDIKGLEFVLTPYELYYTDQIYERAALYFGDIDENGVPLFITKPDMPDYQNPCRIPMLSDIPGYNEKYK